MRPFLQRALAFVIATLALSACAEATPIIPTALTPLPIGRCLNTKDCSRDEFCQHPDLYYPCGICQEDPTLNECGTDQPCPNNQTCVKIAPPCYCGYFVCVESCDLTGCPAGEACQNDGTCQPLACKTENDCAGLPCIEGLCSQEPGYCSSREPSP